jgi:CcmD family protein
MKHNLKKITTCLILTLLSFVVIGNTATAQTLQAEHSSAPEANLPFLFAAYAVTWVTLSVYFYYLSQKQRDIQSDLDSLRQDLNK